MNTIGLQGPGNILEHQLIISDLIYGVRNAFKEKRWSKKYMAISEISFSELGYYDFKHNYNIDFLIYEKKTNNIKLILEIERKGRTMSSTKEKIKECLEYIPDLEAFIIQIKKKDIDFITLSLDKNGKLKMEKNKSRSKFLKKDLKAMIKSIKE